MPLCTPAIALFRTSLAFSILVLTSWGCSPSGTLMEPEAEPLATAAAAGVNGLVPYLEAYGIPVVEVYVDDRPQDPLLEKRYVLDFGVQGQCSIETFYTEQTARQAGSRNANEVRDLRGPRDMDLTRPAPRGRPAVANNPTFLYGRFVALCGQDARVRRAFRALELHVRNAQERAAEGSDPDDA